MGLVAADDERIVGDILMYYYHDLMVVFHFLMIRDYGVIVIHFQVSVNLLAD